MLILTVPFKFDTPSPDDMVTTGLKSSRNFRKGTLGNAAPLYLQLDICLLK
jgi:hypothetical protein